MNVKWTVGVVALALSLPVMAQAPVKPVGGGSAIEVKLACPAGTRQVGGPQTAFEASLCLRTARDGSRVFHGPYVAYWQNGIKQAEGQYDENFRTGKWTYFDEKGVKTGETSFRLGDYDGLRVEFWPNGQKKLEETYVMGKRQGSQKMFDQTGRVLSTTDFIDDRPVAK